MSARALWAKRAAAVCKFFLRHGATSRAKDGIEHDLRCWHDLRNAHAVIHGYRALRHPTRRARQGGLMCSRAHRSYVVACTLFAEIVSAAPAFGARKKPPPPAISGVDHIVVVMMENRSFDHLLGWLPNADGQQAGLTYTDSAGTPFVTAPLGVGSLTPDYMGCGHPDPDHSWQGGRIEYDNGAMDGFLRAGQNDQYAIGYYVEPDRPFFNALARNYTTCDRFFASIMAETYPNRIFQHAAQTDR